MSASANICERWIMPLPDTEEGDTWFLDWLMRSPKHVGGHLSRSFHAFQSVLDTYQSGDISSAMEYFGGMGAHALMIEDMFQPDYHLVQDFSQGSVDHMLRVLPEHIEVRQADSYAEESFMKADLVAFDCGNMTVWRTREGEDLRIVLDRIFGAEPKAVLLTDIALPYLHLQRKLYEGLMGEGTCATAEGYLRGLADRIEDLYGYTMTSGFYDRWSTVMTFVPESVGTPGGFHPTPESPVGLELL